MNERSETTGDELEEDQDYDEMSLDEESDAGSNGTSGTTHQDLYACSNVNIEPRSPLPPTVGEVRRLLHPLQVTADRVGKQVERFAEHLDRYIGRRPKKTQKDCRHLLPLVNEYKKIASDTVKQLKKDHALDRHPRASGRWRHRLRSSSRRSSFASSQADDDENRGAQTSVKDLKNWEQEAQTWELLALMLQVQYPIPPSEAEKLGTQTLHCRPRRGSGIHRFSSEKDAWDRFLAENDLAWERHTVVEWLKNCADASSQDIDEVVKDLESGADIGTGLWAHGWLYTKEAIKKQKRLRSWPQVLDPDDPGLETSLRKSDQSKALITQLDPDAVTRQARDLESQDLYFERAMWLACWEMIRRGKDWSFISEWCREKTEGWRATMMRSDPRTLPVEKTSIVSGWQSRALWRKTCTSVARDGGIDKYEKAVYGILGGSLQSVLKVCGNWNDYLFAHYNSDLLCSFDDYVGSNYPGFATRSMEGKTHKMSSGDEQGSQIVERMKRLDVTKKQANTLPKALQGGLVAKSFQKFVLHHGVRLAQSVNAEQKSKIIAKPRETQSQLLEDNVTAPISMGDYDMLRILSHMLFIFQDLGMKFDNEDDLSASENIVAAYIEFLSKAGKQQLLPLYASRLSRIRASECLARQLPLIQDHGERLTVVSLMEKSGLDVPGILMTQLQLIILDAPPRPKGSSPISPLNVLEASASSPGKMRAIRKSFIGNSISNDDYDLINGFEWFLLMRDLWYGTMSMGTVLYKHFLRKYLFFIDGEGSDYY